MGRVSGIWLMRPGGGSKGHVRIMGSVVEVSLAINPAGRFHHLEQELLPRPSLYVGPNTLDPVGADWLHPLSASDARLRVLYVVFIPRVICVGNEVCIIDASAGPNPKRKQ